MRSITMQMILLAGMALSAGIGTTIATVAPAAAAECMTDDGYGRKRPCSASYKKAHPDWRASDQCYTDDGYGRKRPCSAAYKAKYKK